MPTIIDALIVTLGMNASSYMKASADARAANKKMTEEERKASADAEIFARKRIDGYRRIRNELIGLLAVFTAGREIKQLTTDITNNDAALGRLARNVGMTTQQLSAWEEAAKRAGGSAASIDGAINGLTQQFQVLALTGQSSVIPYFRAAGVAISDVTTGKLLPMQEILLKSADALSKYDPAKAQAIGAGMGFDVNTVNLLIQGRAKVQQLLDEVRGRGLPSPEDARRAQEFQNSLFNLEQHGATLARTLLNKLTPAITHLFESLDKWLSSLDWDEISKDISSVFTAIENVLSNTTWDSVKTGLELVLGVFVGIKMIGAIAMITRLGLAIAGVRAAITGGGAAVGASAGLLGTLFKWFGMGSVLAAGAVDIYRHSSAGGGEDAELKARPGGFAGNPMPLAPDEEWKRSHPLESWWQRNMPQVLGGGRGGNSNVSSEVPPEGRALLDSIAPGESNGTYADQRNPTSGARGRYQFLDSTWAEVSNKTGLKDFTPENQDRNAWSYAQERYRIATHGGDLSSDLKSGKFNPDGLNKIWTSLPGGSEHNVNTDGFNDRLRRNMMNLPAMPSGGGKLGSAVDLAATHLGQGPGQINPFLASGGTGINASVSAWCAAFVNATLKTVGADGSHSAVATSFLKWGTKIAADQVRKGDVLVEARGHAAGETGGHVGFATGNTQMVNGKLQLEMLAGNSGDGDVGSVMKYWEDSSDVEVRRSQEAGRASAGAFLASREGRGSSSTSSTTNIHGPIAIHTQATDSKGIAGSLRQHLQQYDFVQQANAGLA